MTAQYPESAPSYPSNPVTPANPVTPGRSSDSSQGQRSKSFPIILVLLILIGVGWFLKDRFLPKPGVVTVLGEGKVQVKPDFVWLTASWIGQANTSNEALNNERALRDTLFQVLANYGVNKEEVDVAYTQVVKSALSEAAYSAVNAMDIKLYQVNKLDELVAALYNNGAYNVANIVFGSDSPKSLEEQAIEKAIADAKENAQKTAKSSGKKLGRLVSLTTNAVGSVAVSTSKMASDEGADQQAMSGSNQIEVVRMVSVV